MSLSNNTDLKSPANRYFEWSSTDKAVKWYDKEAKENVLVELPFTFIVLDMLSTVKGFSDADGGGIWSNEVRDTRKDILTVRTKRGIKGQGIYQEVKGSVEGARYCRSVYIAYRNEAGELTIGNFQMHGTANAEWIEFSKQFKVYGVGIQVVGSEERKKGSNKFFAPVFATVSASEETIAQAIELDKELQVYLKAYLGREQEATHDDYSGLDDSEFEPDMSQEIPDEIADRDAVEERAAMAGGW